MASHPHKGEVEWPGLSRGPATISQAGHHRAGEARQAHVRLVAELDGGRLHADYHVVVLVLVRENVNESTAANWVPI